MIRAFEGNVNYIKRAFKTTIYEAASIIELVFQLNHRIRPRYSDYDLQYEQNKCFDEAIRKGDVQEVKKLIKSLNLTFFEKEFCSFVYIAISGMSFHKLEEPNNKLENDRLEIVKILLKGGADTSSSWYSDSKRTFIIDALDRKNIELAKLLIKFGANYNLKDPYISIYPELVKIHRVIKIMDSLYSDEIIFLNYLLEEMLDEQLPKLTSEELDIIVNRVETHKNGNIKYFITNLEIFYNKGFIDDKLYNAIMTQCPRIAKYCIEQITPYYELYKEMNLAQTNGQKVKLTMPAELVTYIISFLSPTGFSYDGYSNKTGFKPGVNDHIITYSWNEEKQEEEPVLTVWGRICEFIDNIE
jgi:hypothetical protein